jgi:hypothetical protein
MDRLTKAQTFPLSDVVMAVAAKEGACIFMVQLGHMHRMPSAISEL